MFIERFDKFARQIVHPDEAIVLMIHGYFSRNGIDWMRRHRSVKLMSLCFQPTPPIYCSHVTATSIQMFQSAVRKTRDVITGKTATNVHATGFKIKLAVAGHAAITAHKVRD